MASFDHADFVCCDRQRIKIRQRIKATHSLPNLDSLSSFVTSSEGFAEEPSAMCRSLNHLFRFATELGEAALPRRDIDCLSEPARSGAPGLSGDATEGHDRHCRELVSGIWTWRELVSRSVRPKLRSLPTSISRPATEDRLYGVARNWIGERTFVVAAGITVCVAHHSIKRRRRLGSRGAIIR